MTRRILISVLFSAFIATSLYHSNSFAGIKMKPTPVVGLNYQKQLLPDNYDPKIPSPESLLGFPVGKRTATPAQIAHSVNSWATASDKMQLVEYARTHEDRPLYYAIISTPENLANIDSVKQDLAKLANPKDLSSGDAKKIIDRLPAVSWMAY